MQSTSRSHSRSPRPSQDGLHPERTPRTVDFAAGTWPAPSQRESASGGTSTTSGTLARGRERTRSFLGLGFGSTTPNLSDTEPTGISARRKISFGPLGPAQSGGAGPSTSRGASPAPLPPTSTARKSTSTAKAFIRRAKSFGTSPLLGSSTDSGFDQHAADGSSVPSSTHPSPTSPRPIPLPRTSTSSLLVANPLDARYGSPAAFSPTSESASFTDSGSPYPFANSRASTSSMVLPEALPAQPHWLFAPAPVPSAPTESPGASSGARSSSERASGRRSQDAERRRMTDECRTDVKGKGKAKASEKAQPTPKRKTRRATLGSLFGRKDSKASVDSSGEGVDSALDFAAPGSDRRLCDSPQDSPVPTFPDVDSEREAVPSLPSLPSLQFSRDPYRMSWGFAHSSPTSSPEKPREPRPRVAISTSVSNGSPGPSSPVVALTRAEEAVDADQTIILLPAQGQNDRPLPPPAPPILQHVQSTDSALTLQARRPSTVTALDALETAREELKASNPPALRQRSNSYGFPNPTSPRAMYAVTNSSSIPLTPSPLASPVSEPENPLSGAPQPMPASISSVPAAGFAKSLIKTRTARSHSDASDRRSPSHLASSTGGASFSHLLSSSGATLPAMPRASSSRPTTADALTTSTRSSVFGSIGSFFSGGGGGGAGSAPMSRSGSASMSLGNASTPSASPSLIDGMRETNEFGALFDGADRRSSSLARPGSSRKRGLSVGAGVGFGLFGASSSSASLGVPPAASTASTSSIAGRGRSGSTSSANTSVSGAGSGPLSDAMASLVVPPSSLGSSLGGRMRALTDPNRRFSFGLPGSGGDTPGGSPARAANRPRGSSLSAVSQSHPVPAPPPKKARRAPKPRQDEAPEDYVRRLLEGSPAEMLREDTGPRLDERASSDITEDDEPIPRGELTQILSASPEPFFAEALRAFLQLFPFQGLALDIALRVFLGSAALPTETQHIDRVMEAFARRYCDCNPNVFGGLAKKRDIGEEGVSAEGTDDSRGVEGAKRDGQEDSDIPYVLAFSMVMLNTDHFNPNAKTKMTKADYIRNTRMDGVAPEILEYLFDQITLAPFVYVDDRNRTTADFALWAPSPQAALNASIGPSTSSSSFMSATGSVNGSSQFVPSGAARGKVDPYQLIASGQTGRYRVDVESLVPSKSPFSFSGTTSFFDMTSLHSLFAHAPVLQIANRSRASSRSNVGPGFPGSGAVPASSSVDPATVESPNPLVFGSPLLPTNSNSTFVEPPKKKDRPLISTLKITKVGLLSRKEDLAEGGKKAQSRKWRGWSVVLTGSQLLFFKDSHFASNLQSALDRASAAAEPRPPGHVLAFSYPGAFKPDAVLSLAHSVAIYDSSYIKYRNVFRLIVPAGRQYLFQAHDIEELNSWVHAINYAASFKSAGLKIRPLVSTPMLARPQRSPTPPFPAGQASRTASIESGRLVRSQAHGTLPGPAEHRRVDIGAVDSRRSSESQPAGDAIDAQVTLSRVLDPPGPEPTVDVFPAARAQALRAKVAELDALIRSSKENLQADLRFARHLALLTPFRTSTRERILSSIPPIEKRVRHLRMQLAKYAGYREVLLRDLLVEDRESERLMRQHSLHRTHSRRTSSVPRQRSGASLARESSLRVPNGAPQLGRSGSSRLRPPSLAPVDANASPRNSFESAAESLSAFDDTHEPAQHSLTDDELDRLHVKVPPPMQRSKTETDWVRTTVLDRSLLRPAPDATHEPADLLRVPGSGATSGDDELEEEAAGIDLPSRRSSESRRPDEEQSVRSPSSPLQSPSPSASEAQLPPPVPPI